MISTRRFPIITIDHEKCTVPFLCKKCLQVCPEMVFYVERVMAKEERLKEMDPRIDGNYVLTAPRRNKCIVCNKCIEVCPVDAIKIEVPSGVARTIAVTNREGGSEDTEVKSSAR